MIYNLISELSITEIVSLIGITSSALIAGYSLKVQGAQNKSVIDEQRNRESINRLERLVFEVYSPLILQREQSLELYIMLKKSLRKSEEENWSLLVELTEKKSYTNSQAHLITKMIHIGKLSNSIIQASLGLVSNKVIREGMVNAATHFTLIDMASEGKIDADINPHLLNHLYPKELLDNLKADQEIILREIEDLRN